MDYFYFVTELAVNIQQKNTDRITHAIYDRPKGTPLITVSNHSSCIDDPLLWGKCGCVCACVRACVHVCVCAANLVMKHHLLVV